MPKQLVDSHVVTHGCLKGSGGLLAKVPNPKFSAVVVVVVVVLVVVGKNKDWSPV